MVIKKQPDGKIDLILVQGKTWSIYFKTKDENGNIIDLTNVELRGQIRKTWNDANIVASWNITKTNPTQGEFRATLPPAVTASIPCGDTIKDPKSQYVYDFEIEFPDGTVMEIIKGKLLVEWEVTK